MGTKGILVQTFTAFTSSFGSLLMGVLTMWPSYTLNKLTSDNSTVLDVPMNEYQSSLVGSLPSLGAMFGTAVIPFMISTFGRKKTGFINALPYIVSWTIVYTTKSATVLLVARFLGGVAGGAFFVFSPIFISEISQDSIRGALTAGPMTFYCSGSLVSYLLGWFLDYDAIIWCNLAMSVLSATLFLFITESPHYLLREKRDEDAKKALAHYRGASPDSKEVIEELSIIKAQVTPADEMVSVTAEANHTVEGDKERTGTKASDGNQSSVPQKKMSTIKLLFVSQASRRAFIIVVIAVTLQMLMGMQPVLVYAATLFEEAVPNLSADLCSVLLGLTTVIGCAITVLLSDKGGRKLLMIGSSVMVGLCMTFLGILLQTEFLPAVVSAVLILLYCLSFNFGVGTVPFVWLAELFIPEVQGLASMILLEWTWFLNFVALGIFPFMTNMFGIYNVFFVFAIAAFVNAILTFFNVPETKGLSNAQIQESLVNEKSLFSRMC